MKIAHVTSQLCRASAGLGVAVAAISAATVGAGSQVRVFGLSSPDWLNGDDAAWAGAPATVFDPISWSGPLKYAPDMLKALLDFKPDVVHLHGLWNYPAIAAYHWHRQTGRPIVVSAHGMLTPVALGYNRWRKRIARSLFQDRLLQTASVLHATSSDEYASYRSFGLRNRIAMIPLGMDILPVPEVDRSELRRRLLFLGRLHHQKGIDWLIEAWVRLERDFLDWDLSIVGPTEPSYVREITRLKKAATGKRVDFVGPLYASEKHRYLASCDLFVMPSRSENFGLAAAEALMMKVPVIAMRGTPWSGLVDANAGWWIDPGAIALELALREAMSMTDAERRLKGQHGRQWIERDFSSSATAAKWRQAYQELA